ncbi:MAG: hypothetical protein WCS73_12225 [Lentisphaeria bacterium]
MWNSIYRESANGQRQSACLLGDQPWVKGATSVRSRQYLGLLDKATMELILGLNTPEPNAELS